MVGVVPSMAGVVPSMVGLVPSTAGVYLAHLGRYLESATHALQVVRGQLLTPAYLATWVPT